MGFAVQPAANRRAATFETPEEQGFAAVDALVALMILATTITLSLSAVGTARRASLKAEETRRATQLLEGLLTATPAKPGALDGRSGGFAWRVDTHMTSGGGAVLKVGLCERSGRATALQTGRRYALVTTSLCPISDAAS